MERAGTLDVSNPSLFDPLMNQPNDSTLLLTNPHPVVPASTQIKRVEIYTDGGCQPNPGPGGWGAVLIFNGQEKELYGFDPETTNNRMEMMAAIQALEALKFTCRVKLHSDSALLINGFTKNWVS